MSNAYPEFLVFAGLVASSALYRRAFDLMEADAKLALVASSSSTKYLNYLVIGIFLGLLLWRPLLAWVFLGCAYVGLGARSVLRIRRLNLPARAASLVLMGNLAAVLGIGLCSTFFALRFLR